jgi:hypothetical protein
VVRCWGITHLAGRDGAEDLHPAARSRSRVRAGSGANQIQSSLRPKSAGHAARYDEVAGGEGKLGDGDGDGAYISAMAGVGRNWSWR